MENEFSLKPLYRIASFSILIVLFILIKNFADSRTTLVFCDVGQGDGTYIRIRNRIDVVIDAGPQSEILDCIGRYMPFYDRTIEFAFNTHPQKDHYGGFLEILERYRVEYFLINPIDSSSTSFSRLKNLLVEKKVNVRSFFEHDEIMVENAYFRSVWPTNQFIRRNTNSTRDVKYFYTTSRDPNDFSQVVFLTIEGVKILFTGDITPVSENLIDKNSLEGVLILKVPHHGSKNGLIESLLKEIKPKIAIISSGKNNSFGHPSPEIVKMLENYNIKVRRTDLEGDIVYRF